MNASVIGNIFELKVKVIKIDGRPWKNYGDEYFELEIIERYTC